MRNAFQIVAMTLVAHMLVSVAACTSPQRNPRLKKYEDTLSPLVDHATRSDLVELYGRPHDRQMLGRSQTWTYIIMYSSRPSFGSASMLGSVPDQHDELILVFDLAGVLRKWRVRVPDVE